MCNVSTAAFAETEYPEDGSEWNHGMGGVNLWSNYIHPSDKHYSSVTGVTFVRSAVTDPYYWSYANTMVNPFGGNKANYNIIP